MAISQVNLDLVSKINTQGSAVAKPAQETNSNPTSGSIFVTDGAKQNIANSDNQYATSLFKTGNDGQQDLSKLGSLASKLDGKDGNMSGKDIKMFDAAAQKFDADGDGKINTQEKKGLIDFLKDKLGISNSEAEKKAEDPAALSQAQNANASAPINNANALTPTNETNGITNKQQQKQESPFVDKAKHIGHHDGRLGAEKKNQAELEAAIIDKMQSQAQNSNQTSDKSANNDQENQLKQQIDKDITVVTQAYDKGYEHGQKKQQEQQGASEGDNPFARQKTQAA